MLFIAFCFSCEKEETEADKGKNAAKEFCNCLDESSFVKCEDKFQGKHGNKFSAEFIKAFNKEAEKCEVEIQ